MRLPRRAKRRECEPAPRPSSEAPDLQYPDAGDYQQRGRLSKGPFHANFLLYSIRSGMQGVSMERRKLYLPILAGFGVHMLKMQFMILSNIPSWLLQLDAFSYCFVNMDHNCPELILATNIDNKFYDQFCTITKLFEVLYPDNLSRPDHIFDISC